MDERIRQLLVLGREHYAKREYEKAEQVLRLVLEADDRFADVHDMLGVIAHAGGNFASAEHHFERALAINPNYTEAALNLAVTYNDRGRYEKAKEVYAGIKARKQGSSVLSLEPFARGKLANMHADLGQAYAEAGLLHEAIMEYENAVQLCPHFADLRTKLGQLFRNCQEFDKAKEQYEAALVERPGFVPAHMQLGMTLLALGDSTGAGEHWRRVLELEPENVQARMYLRVLDSSRSVPPSSP